MKKSSTCEEILEMEVESCGTSHTVMSGTPYRLRRHSIPFSSDSVSSGIVTLHTDQFTQLEATKLHTKQ